MSDINITLYDILENINDSIKKDDTSGITPTIYSILDVINEINIFITIVDDTIKNINTFSEDPKEQLKQKNELLEYKSEILKIKSDLQNVYVESKNQLIELKDIKSLTEKAIQLNTGDIF